MNQARRSERLQYVSRLLSAFGGVRRNTHVQCFAASNGLIERGHRLFQWCFRIGPVMIEDVHVFEPHSLQALIEAGQQILSRAPLSVGSRPHKITGLCRDEQFVSMRLQVAVHYLTKRTLRRARWWS